MFVYTSIKVIIYIKLHFTGLDSYKKKMFIKKFKLI